MFYVWPGAIPKSQDPNKHLKNHHPNHEPQPTLHSRHPTATATPQQWQSAPHVLQNPTHHHTARQQPNDEAVRHSMGKYQRRRNTIRHVPLRASEKTEMQHIQGAGSVIGQSKPSKSQGAAESNGEKIPSKHAALKPHPK